MAFYQFLAIFPSLLVGFTWSHTFLISAIISRARSATSALSYSPLGFRSSFRECLATSASVLVSVFDFFRYAPQLCGPRITAPGP